MKLLRSRKDIEDIAQTAEALSWMERFVPWLLVISGAIGAFSSLMLSIEEFHHIKHPGAQLACDINPIIGCGSAMDTWQGHVLFGVPNQFWGLAMFSAVLTVGIALLAGAKFKRWFWLGLQGGLLAGLLFAHWFIYESVFVLKHLCPYCMITWVVTITAFWYILLYGFKSEHFRLRAGQQRVAAFLQRHHFDILAFWFMAIIVLILWRFWYYFGDKI